MKKEEKKKAREEKLMEKYQERMARRVKRAAKRILRLRERGITFIRADSALGKKIDQLNNFCYMGYATLYGELYELGIDLCWQDGIIFIQIR